ncbi:MAG: hypothetical protein JKY43_11495 [Phycisphaerales bacterium]|nr:hypothetical protein [Phycisphaerales bacterium]
MTNIHDQTNQPSDDLPLRRMQQRNYAADLVEQQRSSLMTRIHAVLGDDARRMSGTDDILSTVWRRIDRVIMRGRLRAETDEQIFAFVHAVIERTILEKARSSRRLTRRERIAQQIRNHQETPSEHSAAYSAEDVQRLGQMITCPIDREIVLLRGRDLSFIVIAEMMQMEPSAVRMRWSRIRQRVRDVFDEDSSP